MSTILGAQSELAKPIIVSTLPVVTFLSALPVLVTANMRLIPIVLVAQGAVCHIHALRLERKVDRWICGSILLSNFGLSGLTVWGGSISEGPVLVLAATASLISGVAYWRRCLDSPANLVVLVLAHITLGSVDDQLNPCSSLVWPRFRYASVRRVKLAALQAA